MASDRPGIRADDHDSAVSDRDVIADRAYALAYRVSGRADVHGFLCDAVAASGGKLLYASSPMRAPVYLGVQGTGDERLGLLCYPFRCTKRVTRNRPSDEHRAQIRYGAEETWDEQHWLGRDIAGIDTTMVLGVHIEAGIFIGLDPLLYDPLPMGISIEFKDAEVEATQASGWHVWERPTRVGGRRGRARTAEGLETLVAFAPERLLDYAKLERQASALGLDPPLRQKAASAAARRDSQGESVRHLLEQEFLLTDAQILDIIAQRSRLRTAVAGGVAEYHLWVQLLDDPAVRAAVPLDQDGPPDVLVTFHNSSKVSIECKNASLQRYADGSAKVEVQKTRASKGDPSSRYYSTEQFDVLAVCVWSDRGKPEFRFKASRDLLPHKEFTGRIAPLQRVDSQWSDSIAGALDGR